MKTRHGFTLVELCLFLLLCPPCGARTLTQADLDAGAVPKPGDEVILSDFSKLKPQAALSETSRKGRWWLRPYTVDGGQQKTMLMTVERDMDDPESCIVPPVTYPLALEGWYEVWIATYRGEYGGGVDVRLTGDDCFVHINPQAVSTNPTRPKPRAGVLVEMNYKPAADLTGQSLVFQQPFGTYESFHWGFCEASLAYIRLVRLSDEQVAAFKADQAREDRRLIAYDDDNMSRYWMWGYQGPETILRIFEPFRYHDAAFIGLNMVLSTSARVPTPYTDMYVNRMGRLGDKRMRNLYSNLAKNDVDLLELAVERAHKYGMKLLPTSRMSSGPGGPHRNALAKYYLKTCKRLDFAYPEVQDHHVKVVRYFLEHYDVDGFILDFTRHCIHFNPDEPDKARHMGAFSEKMRKMCDEVSAAKGKKLLLCASFSENDYVSGFHQHYLKVNVPPDQRLAYQGIDVEAWVKNGYYDIIMPCGRNVEKFVALTRGTTTKCFPRWNVTRDAYGFPIAKGIHDPKPSEDKKDRAQNAKCGARDFEAGWLKLRRGGADGLYIFNNPQGYVSMRRMGHLDEVAQRVEEEKIYGIIEGPPVEFK